MNKKIQVITEGGLEFGFGHITRTLSLSQKFSTFFKIEFLVYGDKKVQSFLKMYNVYLFNWHKDNNKLLKLINADLLIIDTLYLDERLLRKIESLDIPIILFDDEKRKNILNKGYVIDWTILSDKKEYFNPRKKDVKYFIGAKYISLRKVFETSSIIKINKDIHEIMISFGGSDIRNLTPKILKVLCEELPDVKKNVVIGTGFSNKEEIEKEKDKNTCFLHNLDEFQMLECMKKSDIAISAGGQTLYELAKIGVPTLAILLVENAKDDTLGWEDTGFLINLGWFDNPKLISELQKQLKEIKSFKKRKRMQENAQKHIDLNLNLVDEVMKDLYGSF